MPETVVLRLFSTLYTCIHAMVVGVLFGEFSRSRQMDVITQ
ncbi:hypothetical protein [Legionella bononiensis]|nr:hypothetical protein [Legionella bononiensis]